MKSWRSPENCVTDDYTLDCHCGSALCRGHWKLTELRPRYGDCCSMYTRNRF